MQILKFPNSALFVTCSEVTVFGEELKILLDAMWETMMVSKGMGLAANQVGLIFRMFTMLGPEGEKIYLVNPKILAKSIIPANLKEGCLSAPGELLVLDERASWVKVKFQDETGKEHERVFKDIHSVCIQHEIEHLNGETYLKSRSLNKKKRKELLKKWGIKSK